MGWTLGKYFSKLFEVVIVNDTQISLILNPNYLLGKIYVLRN